MENVYPNVCKCMWSCEVSCDPLKLYKLCMCAHVYVCTRVCARVCMCVCVRTTSFKSAHAEGDHKGFLPDCMCLSWCRDGCSLVRLQDVYSLQELFPRQPPVHLLKHHPGGLLLFHRAHQDRLRGGPSLAGARRPALPSPAPRGDGVVHHVTGNGITALVVLVIDYYQVLGHFFELVHQSLALHFR